MTWKFHLFHPDEPTSYRQQPAKEKHY